MCSILLVGYVDIGKDEEQSPNLTVGFHRMQELYYRISFAKTDSDYF